MATIDLKEYVKQRRANQFSDKKETKSSGVDLKEYVKQRRTNTSVASDIVNRVNTWLKNNESFVTEAQNRFSGDNTTYRSDASDWLSTATTWNSNFDKEATSIKSYMDQNKDILGDEFIKTVTDALGGNLKVQGDILSASTEDMNFWSNWDSEDAYKKYLDDQATYEKRLNYNLEAGQKNINYFQSELDAIESIERQIAEISGMSDTLNLAIAKGSAYASGKQKDNEARLATLRQALEDAYAKYGSKDALMAALTSEKQKYTLAERTQRADKLAAVARTDSEYYDPNFSNYAVVNESFAENDDSYKYINDLNGFREDRNAYWQDNATTTNSQGLVTVNKLPWYMDGGYEEMNEDEIAIYNYYYNVGGREKANEYLESIEEHLQYRKGMREYGEMDTNVEKYLFAVYAGLDQFATNVANLFSSDTYMPTNSTQVTSGLIREDLGAGGKVVYDVLNTTSNMLPSILTSTVVNAVAPGAGAVVNAVAPGAVVGAGLMASSAAGGAKAEMLNLGYSKEQANSYAAMVGIAEGSMEYLLGGITKLGGVLPDGIIGKILTKVDNAFARTAIQLGGSMLSEGFEEGLQTVIEPWLKEIATGVDFDDPKIDEILYSSLLGALSAGILEGGGTIASEVSTYKQGQTIKQTDGALDRLMTLGSTFSADTVAGELASKVNEKTGAYTVGRLLNEAVATLSEQNQSDIKAALVNNGMAESDAATISKWLNKAVDGGIFTKSQVAALENNDVISKVFYDVIIKENSTVNQRNKAYSDLMSLADEVSNGNKANAAEKTTENLSPEEIAQKISAATGEDVGELLYRNEIQEKTASATENTSAEKAAKKGSYAVSADGKTKVGDTEVSVKEVASVKDGNVVLRLEDGSTVNASDVEFGSDSDSILYDTMATSNMSAAAANAFINGYDGTVSADQYARGFREAYRYGEYGYPMREMSANGFSSYLTDIQKNLAYNLGKTDAKYRAEAAQAKNGEAKSTKKGELHNTIQPKNERQKASLKTLGVLAKTLGIDIYTYESTAVDGVRREANGWYDPKDGSIHIDIHAGADGKGTMLFTLAHELTHHIREKLPAKFKAFADFLFEQYGEHGVSVSELIAKRMKVLEANGRLKGMTEEQAHDLAYEEIVADACESMLADGEAVAKIAELKTKDKSLWQTIKDFFVNLVARIKAAYEGLEPDSIAGREMAKMLDVAEQLKTMWAEAVVEASEVSDNAENGIKFSDRDLSDDRQFNPNGKTLDELLEDILHTSESFDGRYLYIGRFTSDFTDMVKPYVEIKDLPIAMNYRDAYLSMESKENGKYKGEGINYHSLGKEGLKSAIESFGSPEQVLLSKKEGKIELVLQGVDKKGNKLLSIVALNTNARNADQYIEAHIVTSIYGRRSIERYISKAEEEGRLIYNKKEEPAQVNSQVQYEGIINANSSNNRIAQNSDSVNEKFSDRDPDAISNRALLANALESATTNEDERRVLREYRSELAEADALEAELTEIRAKLKDLSFKRGPKDTEAIRKLKEDERKTINRIDIRDKKLLRLEAAKPIKDIIYREKQKAYKRAAQEGREALAMYRERSTRTQMRHKIKRVVSDLNKLLLHGTKERNVKEELKSTVATSLALAEVLFSDTIPNEKIVRLGVKSAIGKETELVEKYAKLLDERDALKNEADAVITDESKGESALEETMAIEAKINSVNAQISSLNRTLAELFERERALLNRATTDEILESLANQYLELKTSGADYIRAAYDEYIHARLVALKKDIGGTPIKDMNAYQLAEVYDAYTMVLNFVRKANESFTSGKKETISQIATAVIDDLEVQKRKAPYVTKAGRVLSQFDWNNYKPIYAFERIGSRAFTEVFNAVRAGEDVWAKDASEAKAFREEQEKKYGYKKWDFDTAYPFTSTSGYDFELTLSQIMSLYAYSKREQAGAHLRYGGFVFDGITEKKEKTKLGVTVTYQLEDATAYNLSDETLAKIIGKLEPEQKDFVDVMQDYLSTTMGEKGNEVSLALYGVKLFKEKNYFPLKSDSSYLAKAREKAQGEVKIKNSGFTQETVPEAKNPIVLTPFMDVWAGHVNEMSMYHAFTLPLEDFYRVYNYKTFADETDAERSVASALKNAHTGAAVQYIDQLLKDLNGGALSDSRETPAKNMIANFKRAKVMASLSVVIQQPSAIVRATALIDTKYFAGAKVTKGKHKAVWDEVKKYAPVAIIKEMGYFDIGMGRGAVDWIKGEKTTRQKIEDGISKLPALADELTWCAIWNAVKRETLHTHPKLTPNSEAFLEAVGKRFTEVITKTQVYDSTLSRSANMRSKSAFMSMMTSFMAEATTSLNMVQGAILSGNKKVIARTLGAVAGSVILNSVLASFIYAMRDDDEDETFWEKYLSRLTTEVIDGMNPLTYIPFVKDIWSAAQGFDIERADMSLITDLFDALQKLVKVAAKDTSDMDDEELREYRKEWWSSGLAAADTIAALLGLPIQNVRRDINGIINFANTIKKDVTERDTSLRSLADVIGGDVKDSIPIYGWLPDKSKGDKLYDAIMAKDKAYVARLKSGYKTEDAYNVAVRKALRENDSRIKEAAEARYKGDSAKYERLVREIVKEGYFSQDLVIGAVNTELNDLRSKDTKAEEEEKTEKVTSLYSTYDLEVAFKTGKTDRAVVVIDELVKNKMANGMEEKAAKSSVKSSVTSYWKPLYKAAAKAKNEAEKRRIREILKATGLYGNATDIVNTVNGWLKEKE